MKLFKYNQFLNEKPITENLDKAKKFLKDRYLLRNAAQELGYIEGELKAQLDNNEKKSVTMLDFTPEQQEQLRQKLRTLKLTDAQVRNIERDPEFLKIREYLGDKYIGWTYPFTYFYFVEMIPMDELFTNKDSTFNKLIEYTGLLDKLPKKFDHNFIDPNIPNNMEVLVDGLDSLDDYRKIKRVFDQLTPALKKDYNESPEVIKQHFADVARGFDEIGEGDPVKKEKLWKSFFGEIRTIEVDQIIYGKAYKKGDKRYFGPLNRYTNIREFIKAGQNYLKASENETVMKFYEKINECNNKYGILGADIVFEENNVLAIEVKSFQANQYLNGHTRHCIKDSMSQWNNYIGDFNKQYYIYNFNIPQYDNLSTIGITIGPKYVIRACHAKDDAGLSSNIKSLLKKWEKEYDLKNDIFEQLKPMTQEEITRREKMKQANREIVKKGNTKEQILKLVKDDGADINSNDCIAIFHAVEEEDYDKTKTILELGGNPNLKSRSDAVINKAKSLDMIKLLVTYGAELTGEVFRNICHDMDAVEYCLKQGIDVNFDNSFPVRTCFRGSYKSRDDIGEGYFDTFLLLVKYGAKVVETEADAKNVAIKWAAEYGRIEFIDYIVEHGARTGFKNALRWIKHSRKLNDKDKDKIVKYLEDKIEKYEEE